MSLRKYSVWSSLLNVTLAVRMKSKIQAKVISLYSFNYPLHTMLVTQDIFQFLEALVFLVISWVFCSCCLFFNVIK